MDPRLQIDLTDIGKALGITRSGVRCRLQKPEVTKALQLERLPVRGGRGPGGVRFLYLTPHTRKEVLAVLQSEPTRRQKPATPKSTLALLQARINALEIALGYPTAAPAAEKETHE